MRLSQEAADKNDPDRAPAGVTYQIRKGK